MPKDSGDPELGAAIKAARESRGLGQSEVAKAAGFTHGWLGNVERGHRGIDARSFSKVAQAVGKTMYELLDLTVAEDEAWLARLRPFLDELDVVQREEIVRLAEVMADIRRSPVYDLRRVPPAARPRRPTPLRPVDVRGVTQGMPPPREKPPATGIPPEDEETGQEQLRQLHADATQEPGERIVPEQPAPPSPPATRRRQNRGRGEGTTE